MLLRIFPPKNGIPTQALLVSAEASPSRKEVIVHARSEAEVGAGSGPQAEDAS